MQLSLTMLWSWVAETGKCRLFVRYARNIAPWFHPPGWAFNIILNNFLDQARFDPALGARPVSYSRLKTL